MRVKLILLFFLTVSNVLWSDNDSPASLGSRIHAHLIIKDTTSAVAEAKEALKLYSHDKTLWISYIAALSADHREKLMMQAWKDFISIYPEEKENREVLETLAWGVIRTASHSSLPLVRVTSLLGATFSQDVKGVALLKAGLQDQNNLIRAIAVKLSVNMRDQALQEGVLNLFHGDKSLVVRMEAIRAVGAMGMKNALPYLIDIAGSQESTDEEKAAAVESIVTLMDTADRSSILRLSQSGRAGLRLLACQAVSYFNLTEELDLIVPLLRDSHSDVKVAALRTLGTITPRPRTIDGKAVSELAEELVKDSDEKISVIAAWLLILHDRKAGMTAFERCFKSKSEDIVRLAAAALATVGEAGFELTNRMMKSHQDPFVKMNLAFGLIRMRKQCSEGCKVLFDGLQEDGRRWMFKEFAGIKVLMPSDISYGDRRIDDPETVNVATRLEILNLLAVMRYPDTQNAIKQFLKESRLGATGMASAMLLTEGDEEAVELIENLLNDKDRDVRVQAGLVLAMWGQSEKALAVLQNEYDTVNRETKERILEGLANIHSKQNIPFLVNKLEEPYQTLRLIAAAALLITLYH